MLADKLGRSVVMRVAGGVYNVWCVVRTNTTTN